VELFLNVFWLCVTLAAPLAWLVERAQQPSRRRIAVSLFAFACIAILLFPVISATDDLHIVQVASEDSSACKKLIQAGGHLAAIGIACAVLLEQPALWSGITDTEQVISARESEPVNISNRPPPATLSA
jgi:hypothetical protein